MRFGYPVFLELAGKKAVVIGSKAVREAKDRALREAGAVVEAFENGAWAPLDLDGAFVCVASSDDPAERDAIAQAARERGVLVGVMDDVPNCDFAAPAIVRRGDLVLAVSTGGRSPALARKVREDLDARFGAEWEAILDVIGKVRAETSPRMPDPAVRARRWRQALELAEAAELVRTGRAEQLRRRLRRRLMGEEVV